MSLNLCSITNGDFTVVLPDHKGQPHTYRVEFEPPGRDSWRLLLTRLDVDKVYRISLSERGYRCSCESFLYSPPESKSCKHCEAGERLHELIEMSNAATQPAHETSSYETHRDNGREFVAVEEWPIF